MRLKTLLKGILVAILVLQLTGCGTLLYPERRGLEAGRLNADVVLLDAIGLFFFVIPGVIAFAVDLTTGAIYLPKGKKSRVGELLGNADAWGDPHGRVALTAIEAAASAALGSEIDLAPGTTWVSAASPGTEVSPMVENLMQAALRGELLNNPGQTWQTLGTLVHESRGRSQQQPLF